MRVNSGDGSLGQGIGKRRHPPFRLPFVRIWTPQRRITVAIQQRHDDDGILRNDNFMHLAPINARYRSEKWQYSVFHGPESADAN